MDIVLHDLKVFLLVLAPGFDGLLDFFDPLSGSVLMIAGIDSLVASFFLDLEAKPFLLDKPWSFLRF
jgi:hypothetical protein